MNLRGASDRDYNGSSKVPPGEGTARGANPRHGLGQIISCAHRLEVGVYLKVVNRKRLNGEGAA